MKDTTLGNVLVTHDRFYIPNYQRDYAWRKEQFDDLWNDLEESVEIAKESNRSNDGHFLGTIVIAPHGEGKEYDLIDGQQRMTTIFMLLSVLIEKSTDEELRLYLIKGGKPRFQVIKENQQVFNDLLEKAGISDSNDIDTIEKKTQGQENLCEVFKAILDKASGLHGQDIETYIKTLLDMRMLVLKENSAGRAIRTFQSVNDRGVHLNILDKLKSLLIYYSNRYCDGGENGLDDDINKSFREIFRLSREINKHTYGYTIGGANFDDSDMIRYHIGSGDFITKTENPHYRDSTEKSYKKIKDEFKERAKDRENFKDFLQKYTNDLVGFFAATHRILERIKIDKEIFECMILENLSTLFYPTLIRLEMMGGLSKEMAEIITKVDCILLKFNGSEAKAYELRLELHDDTKDKAELIENLREKAKQLCKNNKLELDSRINDFVSDGFKFKQIFHYLFFKHLYPEVSITTLNDKLIVDKKISLEIEHILPQALEKSESSLRQYGFSSAEEFRSIRNNYGNLLSLEKTLNSQASNKDLTGKKSVYDKSVLSCVRNFNLHGFNKDCIDERNKQAAKFFKEKFFKDFMS